ncbi:hypothetical protein niasHT_004475 [Heterodera trifolii]|uniref:Uncharacterized protein n=1 Tax=Heterodera trifolii TaxID=157864 RepID=A0ABD2MDB2_9BILA
MLSNSSASVDKKATSCDASIQRISIQFAPFIEGIATAKDIALEFTKKDGKNYALTDYSLGVAFFPAQKASQSEYLWGADGIMPNICKNKFRVAQLESEQFNKLALCDASSINFEIVKLLIVFCIWICGRRSGEASGSGRQNSAPVRVNKGGGGPQRGGGKGGGAGKGGGRAPVEEEDEFGSVLFGLSHHASWTTASHVVAK